MVYVYVCMCICVCVGSVCVCLRGWLLTVVILLAFLSMSEALLRQECLLRPEKAATADPAHAFPPASSSGCVCVIRFSECVRMSQVKAIM